MSNRILAGLGLVAVGLGIAAAQLTRFYALMAHTSSWTDGQAESWIVFSPVVDGLIVVVLLALVGGGAFLLLPIKKRWVRVVIAAGVTLCAWLAFYAIQFDIQHHFSGFRGV